MKVLHVIQTLATRYGGPVSVLKALSQYQVRNGLRVTICTTNSDYPVGTMSVPSCEPVFENNIATWYHPVHIQPLLFSFSLMNWINTNIKKFDVVHIHGLYRFPVTYAAWAARKADVPYIITPHGALDPFLYKQSRYTILLKRLYEWFFDFPNIRCASAINFTTQQELQRCGFLGFKMHSIVTPIGIDWSKYAVLPRRGSFRKSIGIDGDSPIVLFLGRINFKKGLDLLVQAFSELTEHIGNAILVIAGPDNEGYAEVVRKWIADRRISKKVYWQEMLNETEVIEAYVDADVFVLPSYTENFGIAVAEAMACGLPVVISDQVNLWPDILNSNAGLVVGLDSQKIASAILTIIKDKKLTRQMGDAGRKFAKHSYSYDRVIQKVIRMYETIIRSKSTTK